MKLIVNGAPQELPDGQSVAALVEKLGLAGRAVAVEVNRQVVRKKDHGQHRLADGDRIEIVTLVGGG